VTEENPLANALQSRSQNGNDAFLSPDFNYYGDGKRNADSMQQLNKMKGII
jgi:hypothetical protein